MGDKGITMTSELRDYLVTHSIERTDVHRRLVHATATSLGDLSVMQIAEEQGALLTFLARLIGARTAVEVGTFTGYSALCIAEGLPEDGQLTCFDISEEWTSVGRPYWDEAGVGGRIGVIIGPAADTLAAWQPSEPVDLAFVDADKPGYPTYYELLLERLRPGGLIVVDNALYFGAVLDEDSRDDSVVAIRAFNDLVAGDDRVECVLMNVGDGLLCIRKR